MQDTPWVEAAEWRFMWIDSCAFSLMGLTAACIVGTGSTFAARLMDAWVSMLVPALVLRGLNTALTAGLFTANLLALVKARAAAGA